MVGQYTRNEKADYNTHRDHVTDHLGIDKNAYNAYRRHGQALHRADENSANGTRNGESPRYEGSKLVNGYTEEHYDKETKPIHAKLKEMTKTHGLHYYHQSDPRGATLHLAKEKLDSNNYSSKGHAIY